MDFASPYCLISAPEELEIAEEDLHDGLAESARAAEDQAGSVASASAADEGEDARLPAGFFGQAMDSVSGVFSRAPASLHQASAGRSRKRTRVPSAAMPGTVYRRQVDTNVVSLPLGRLAETVDLATGEAVFCTSCGAALHSRSVLLDHTGARIRGPDPLASSGAIAGPAAADAPSPAEPAATSAGTGAGASAAPSLPAGMALLEGEYCWTCEFCSATNKVMLDREEIPSSESVDYILEAASSAVAGAGPSVSESAVIFCLDVSGSMCVTTAVPGRLSLKGDHTSAHREQLAEFTEGHYQYLPGQRRDQTFVSRLQGIQAAVGSQLEALRREFPSCKVGLVTFAGDVTVYGDGSGDPIVVAGDRLSNKETLQTVGRENPITHGAEASVAGLLDRLYKLEEGGPTALGPAAIIAVAQAVTGGRGSRVVIATDGVANTGLGSLEADDHESDTDIDEFYRELGEYAAEQGIIIDVVGIEGDGCAMEYIGNMSDLTGGETTLVNPASISSDFPFILANPVVATCVSATMFLHRGLHFRNLDPALSVAAATGGLSKVTKDIGNVTSDTEVTFEYGCSADSVVALTGLSELPFQVQLRFTKSDGMKVMRVITQVKKVTRDRAIAEQSVAIPVLCCHAAQQASAMAQAGDYLGSRVAMNAWSHVMRRNVAHDRDRTAYGGYIGAMDRLDSALHSEMEAEAASAVPISAASRKKNRSKKDSLSSGLYSLKKAGKSMFAPVSGPSGLELSGTGAPSGAPSGAPPRAPRRPRK